jgi:hypothetical protein
VPTYVILIHGLVNGDDTPYDGTYLKRFDFHNAPPGEANLYTVATPQEAAQFPDLETAREELMKVDPRAPIRRDGKPNRPLTAFSVSIEPV